MIDANFLEEIREANLSYLILAQQLIRHNKQEAVFRLGINEESAAILAGLSAAQVIKLASRNTLLARFRVDDELVWGLLTNHDSPSRINNDALNKIHANILMAGHIEEVV